MPELWQPIPGWEGYYSASTLGQIRREAGSPRCPTHRLLTPRLTERGYHIVAPVRLGWRQRPMMVHRLILETFVSPAPSPDHEGNHRDGNKINNRADNLEWTTRAENIQHAYDTGLHGRYVGSAASAAKLTEGDVVTILDMVAARAYRKDIAARFGISTKMIDEIVSGNHWQHVPRPDLGNKRTGRHILTEDDVRAIKILLATGNLSHRQIGEQFGVSGPTIWQIADGRTWRHISSPPPPCESSPQRP